MLHCRREGHLTLRPAELLPRRRCTLRKTRVTLMDTLPGRPHTAANRSLTIVLKQVLACWTAWVLRVLRLARPINLTKWVS